MSWAKTVATAAPRVLIWKTATSSRSPALWWMTCTREFILDDPAIIRPWVQCIPFAEPGYEFWYSLHTSVYDIAGRTLRIYLNENYDDSYEFGLAAS